MDLKKFILLNNINNINRKDSKENEIEKKLNIDLILFINLKKRKDRLEHITNEINKMNIENSKIVRIDAIFNKNGALGCSLSHIKAIEYFLYETNYDNCLILEDDFTFSDKINNINEKINLIQKEIPDYDICLFAYNNLENYNNLKKLNFKRVKFAQTTSGYLIKRKFADKLLKNFNESSELMKKEDRNYFNCLDIYWNKLTSKSKWYAFNNALGYQMESYSDIENKIVNYKC